jgi:hypothetical protein
MPAHILRPGKPSRIVLYTRCEDELLCRAELLLLLEATKNSQPVDQMIVGYYDVDRTFTNPEFKRGY